MKQTTPIQRDPARIQEVLPWYVNDTLGTEDRAWVEQMLAAQGEQAGTALRAQVELDRSLAAALERKVAQVPVDIGWASLLRQVRADAMPEAAGKSAGAGNGGIGGDGSSVGNGGSWMRRLGGWFAPLMSPQLGMGLAVLVAVQAVTIGWLLGGREGEVDTVEYRTGGGVAPVAVIRALLNESITEKAMRDALSANGASIVDGPNPLGEYWIAAGQRDPETVAGALRDAGVIASYVIDQRQRRQ